MKLRPEEANNCNPYKAGEGYLDSFSHCFRRFTTWCRFQSEHVATTEKENIPVNT